MYSPKISEDLIPLIFRIKQWRRKPMTEIVDNILRSRVLTLHDEVVKEETAFYDCDELEDELQRRTS